MPAIIKQIQFIPLKLPLIEPLVLKEKTVEHLYVWVCKIRSDTNVEGQGYTYSILPSVALPIIQEIQQQGLNRLLDKEVTDINGLHAWFAHWIKEKKDPRFYYYFLSAIDIAYWDLKLKIQQISLKQYLDVRDIHVSVYGSGGWLSFNDEQLLTECRRYQEQGIFAYKMKIGGPRDEQRLALLRKELGDNICIYADSNQAYPDVKSAQKAAEMLEKYHVEWFEEPIKGDTTPDLIALSKSSPVPIATGENRFAITEFAELCQQTGVQYIQPDVVRCGGITGFLAIAKLCEQTGKRLTAHLNPELSATLIAHSSVGHSVEQMTLFSSRLFTHPVMIANGKMPIPDQAGTGINFSEDTVTQFRIAT